MSEKQIAQQARKLRRIMSEQLGFGPDFDSLSPGDKVVVDCAATGQFRWSDAVADRDVDRARTGVGVKVIGQINMEPLPQLQATPGTPAWDFIEQAARYRETVLGSDQLGNLLLIGARAPMCRARSVPRARLCRR